MSRRKKDSFDSFIDELNYSVFMVSEYKIDNIKDYLLTVEKYLIEKTSEISDKISEWQNSEKEQQYSGIEYYIEDYTNYNTNFKKLKLESTFLSSYSLFEHYLKSFTSIYTNYYSLKITVDDLNGNNYISKSKKYLEKVVNIDLEKTNPLWVKITKYQKIRNKIVHSNAKFSASETEIIKELSKMNGIEINSNGWIKLNDKQFIFDFLKLFEDYINGIIKITIEKNK